MNVEMFERRLQLQRAAADILSAWFYYDRCSLIEKLRRLRCDPGANAHIAGQDGASRLLAAREKPSPDEELIKPQLFRHLCSLAESRKQRSQVKESPNIFSVTKG